MERIDVLSDEGKGRLDGTFQYVEVGRCVNGVAHDVNNFLGAIMAYTELIGLTNNLPPESQEMLDEIVTAAKKSSHLVNYLTEIARQAQNDARIIEVEQLVDRVLLLRQYEAKVNQVSLEQEVAPGLPVVRLNVPKTVQVLLHLVANALEALQAAKERRVKISAQGAGDSVEIAVWNSGDGPTDEQREAMFEPFVTSKNGQHLGLGLWVARNIAREGGGDLSYDGERGFILRVPKDSGAPE